MTPSPLLWVKKSLRSPPCLPQKLLMNCSTSETLLCGPTRSAADSIRKLALSWRLLPPGPASIYWVWFWPCCVAGVRASTGVQSLHIGAFCAGRLTYDLGL
uniref:BAF chromatin remodeling complex subunit BCL7B n=1 Tax=Rousettus aegyptiacus TaxID=9407 RepID=A0A7J8EWZ8_ROUAE|nr:BAF chromatin remodeling complex subunit BCL7B [Rousettus aegyptiacus]